MSGAILVFALTISKDAKLIPTPTINCDTKAHPIKPSRPMSRMVVEKRQSRAPLEPNIKSSFLLMLTAWYVLDGGPPTPRLVVPTPQPPSALALGLSANVHPTTMCFPPASTTTPVKHDPHVLKRLQVYKPCVATLLDHSREMQSRTQAPASSRHDSVASKQLEPTKHCSCFSGTFVGAAMGAVS